MRQLDLRKKRCQKRTANSKVLHEREGQTQKQSECYCTIGKGLSNPVLHCTGQKSRSLSIAIGEVSLLNVYSVWPMEKRRIAGLLSVANGETQVCRPEFQVATGSPYIGSFIGEVMQGDSWISMAGCKWLPTECIVCTPELRTTRVATSTVD